MVELLVHLNEWIEKSEAKMKRQIYQGAEQAGIDHILDKLQTISRSVRTMKEVEEFRDEWEEWNDSQALMEVER